MTARRRAASPAPWMAPLVSGSLLAALTAASAPPVSKPVEPTTRAATAPPEPSSGLPAKDLPLVRIEKAGQVIDTSCKLLITMPVVQDAGQGALQIKGDNITVDLNGSALRGSPATAAPWDRAGTGIVITGRNVTLRNGAVTGYKVGILAGSCDGSSFEDLDLSSNWGDHLRSSAAAEDGADWLYPHHNDDHEWRTHYGAALCVENAAGVKIARVKAVGGGAQNGILLDRVRSSHVYDCDCSFISGWGLAMWRSCDNIVSRNAFDFCVRGYSHKVYNRGQDSAGILIFEQSSRNIFGLNSVTHGGDGVFGFAGLEALEPDASTLRLPEIQAHLGRGSNGNIFFDNDFSDAVAHGVEMTFSFDTRILRNLFRDCAISGVWGGYSQRTSIILNTFEAGSEHSAGAGVAIEHGSNVVIEANTFKGLPVGVHFWGSANPSLANKAWVVANGDSTSDNRIVRNRFEGDARAIELAECGPTTIGGNTFTDVKENEAFDAASRATVVPGLSPTNPNPEAIAVKDMEIHLASLKGRNSPVGARSALAGREKIIITESGPYDWKSSRLVFDHTTGAEDVWHIVGPGQYRAHQINGQGAVARGGPRGTPITVSSPEAVVAPYEIQVFVTGQEQPLRGRGVIINGNWKVTFFPWTIDPRQDLEGWRAEAKKGVTIEPVFALDFNYGSNGPSDLHIRPEIDAARIPRDRFGMIARSTIRFPAGRWKLSVTSDDGVRVLADSRVVIEHWDQHVPATDSTVLSFLDPEEVEIVVEHFELDGHAVLRLRVEPAD